jgi:hypothetical protein
VSCCKEDGWENSTGGGAIAEVRYLP